MTLGYHHGKFSIHKVEWDSETPWSVEVPYYMVNEASYLVGCRTPELPPFQMYLRNTLFYFATFDEACHFVNSIICIRYLMSEYQRRRPRQYWARRPDPLYYPLPLPPYGRPHGAGRR